MPRFRYLPLARPALYNLIRINYRCMYWELFFNGYLTADRLNFLVKQNMPARRNRKKAYRNTFNDHRTEPLLHLRKVTPEPEKAFNATNRSRKKLRSIISERLSTISIGLKDPFVPVTKVNGGLTTFDEVGRLSCHLFRIC